MDVEDKIDGNTVHMKGKTAMDKSATQLCQHSLTCRVLAALWTSISPRQVAVLTTTTVGDADVTLVRATICFTGGASQGEPSQAFLFELWDSDEPRGPWELTLQALALESLH